MEMPTNSFKRSLCNGRTQYGLWLGIPDTICAEINAGAGFDWLLIDTEHAPYTIRQVHDQLQAIAPYEVSPIVRASDGSATEIKRLLDVGAQTLLIPMVDTVQQAEQLVQAVRYPPAGKRGVGTSLARAARWNRVDNYLHRANSEICLIVQIETPLGISNISAIAQVEGVDAIFIGPSDLSAAMGHNPTHPDIVQTIESALDAVHAADKPVGVLALDAQLIKKYARANFIGVGVDTLLLATATSQLAQRVKSNA